MSEETTPIDVEAQSEIINEFLVGLLDAFGLEGDVHVRVEDGIVHADVTGEQTEALVGNRGVILQSILELCRTVVQRKSHSSARIRLDVAGYAERRREALRIYASRLAEQVLEDGQEAMLEPMNPADRKVVHDAISDIENVRTYSEGEEPNRSVVVSLAPGVEPKGSADQETGESGDDDAEESDEETGAAAAEAESAESDEGGDEASDDATAEDERDDSDEADPDDEAGPGSAEDSEPTP